MAIEVSRKDFRREERPDPEADSSYLDETDPQDRERIAAWKRDEWHYIGIRAAVTIDIPHGTDGTMIEHRVASPGLWGIEDDSDESYLASVFEDECGVLIDMLKELNVTVTD